MLNSIKTLLRSVSYPKHPIRRRNRRTACASPVAAVERLDERVLLAAQTLVWDGGGGALKSFFLDSNWNPDHQPDDDDTVVFNSGTAQAPVKPEFFVTHMGTDHTYATSGDALFKEGVVDINFKDPNNPALNAWVLKNSVAGKTAVFNVGITANKPAYVKLTSGDTRPEVATIGGDRNTDGTLELSNHTLLVDNDNPTNSTINVGTNGGKGLLKARGSASLIEGSQIIIGLSGDGTVDVDGIQTFNTGYTEVGVGGKGYLKIYNMKGESQTAEVGWLKVQGDGTAEIFETTLGTTLVEVGKSGTGELRALYSTINSEGDADGGAEGNAAVIGGGGVGEVYLQGTDWNVTYPDGNGAQVRGLINIGNGAKKGLLDIDVDSTVDADVHVYRKGILQGKKRVKGKVIPKEPGAKVSVGDFNAADGIAQLTVDDGYDATAGGTLFVDLAGSGTAGVDYDQLVVGSTASLGGVLDVKLANGYMPVLPNPVPPVGTLIAQFEVLTATDGVVGQFPSANLPWLGNNSGMTWDVNYDDPNAVWVRVLVGDTPVAGGDSYSFLHNQTLDTAGGGWPSLFDNDYDPNGDPLTAVIDVGPANGSFTSFDENTGHFVYQPPADWVGTDYFTYHVTDGTNDSNIATVTIDVTNTPPTAGDDQYSTPHDTQLSVPTPGVLSNDSEIDPGDVLQAVVLELPANGTLTDGAGTPLSVGSVFDGGFQYTPDPGTAGFDDFTYAADDGYEQSVATVEIDVTNDTPSAGDDWYFIDHDTTLNETAPGVLANDFDMDLLQAYLIDDVSHGSLTLNQDGSFSYTPDFHFVGQDSFTYYVTDGIADSDPATVTIDVYNDVPSAGDDFYSTPMDTPLSDPAPGVMANDFDMDPLEAYLISGASGGNVSLGLDGSFTYTPTAGFTGMDSFTYYVTDGIDDSNPATVTIDVHDDGMGGGGSLAAVDDSYFTPIDVALNTPAPGVMSNDTTGPGITAELDANGSHGFVVLQQDGSFVYTPETGYSGPDSFTYHITDGVDSSDPATVTISVDDMGMETLMIADDFYFTPVDAPLSDVAPGVMLNDTVTPTTIALLDSNASNGFVVLQQDGSFVYTPNAGFIGVDSFTYHLQDGPDFTGGAYVDIQVGQGEPLLAAGRGGDGTFERLQRSQLVAIVDQAIAQWDAVILDPGVRRAMRDVDFRIADLPGNALGWAFPTMIVIDADAAGYGWFIDATPGANEEFRFNSSTGQYEATAGPGADRMDLLTVVLHELGHVAGLDDASARTSPGDVMLPTLDLGVRRLPDEGHAFQFLSQRAAALIARLPDDLRSLTLPARREFQRELDSLLSQIGRQRAAIQTTRPAAEVDSLDSYFATLRDRKELVLWR